jgi:hypothetical protein
VNPKMPWTTICLKAAGYVLPIHIQPRPCQQWFPLLLIAEALLQEKHITW